MANIAEIYNWFMTGKKPTQAQFWASWVSFWNKEEQIPQSAISNLTTVLNAKTENDQFNDHKVASDAHADLFLDKEDKIQKGISGGYAPLDEFSKISHQFLSIVNNLIDGSASDLLSGEQGVVLQRQINGIQLLLEADDVNLDTVQERIDMLKEIQLTLDTILVNDMTTGGTTKALTAEMGKLLDEGKIDKVEGKGLSSNDYTTAEKEKLAGLGGTPLIEGTENRLVKFSDDGLIDSVISEINNKIGVHNDTPDAVLNIKNSPPVETTLTGTFSFDGMVITGVGTSMYSELQREDIIKVVSTGKLYTINDIMQETMAYSFMGGDDFSNEICSVVKINKKILNINDLFEVGYGEYGEPQILIKARIFNQNGSVQNQTDNVNNFQNNYGPEGGQTGISYSFPQGYQKFSTHIGKGDDNLYWFTVTNSYGDRYIKFSENGDFKIEGLPTSPTGNGILYKENGFLKIG